MDFRFNYYGSRARQGRQSYSSVSKAFTVSSWVTRDMAVHLNVTVLHLLWPHSLKHCGHFPTLQLHRVSTNKDTRRLWRAWRFLCKHTAASCAADAAVAAATAASHGGIERRSSQAEPSAAFSTDKSKGRSREAPLRKIVSYCNIARPHHPFFS